MEFRVQPARKPCLVVRVGWAVRQWLRSHPLWRGFSPSSVNLWWCECGCWSGSWMIKKGSSLNMLSLRCFYFWFAAQKDGLEFSILVCFQPLILTSIRMPLPRVERICSVVVHVHASQLNLMLCGDCINKILKEYYIKNSFECFKRFLWLLQNVFLWHSGLHFDSVYFADWTKADLINNFIGSCWPLNYIRLDNIKT